MAKPTNNTFDFGSPGEYYVYLYRDPRPGKWLKPIYVGKGTRNRKKHHWLYGTHNRILSRTLDKIRECGLKPKIEVVCWCETEEEAFAVEREVIAKYGRRDLKKGPLLNRTDGGDGACGALISESTREKLSTSFKKLWSEDQEYASHLRLLRKSHSYRRRMSRSKAGQTATAETKAKMSAAHRRWYEENPEVGGKLIERMRQLKRSPEVEAKRLEAMKKRWASPLERERCSNLLKQQWADPEIGAARRTAMKRTARLSDETVIEIRTKYANGGVKLSELAKEYLVAGWYVSQLVRGLKRVDVGGPITPAIGRIKQ